MNELNWNWSRRRYLPTLGSSFAESLRPIAALASLAYLDYHSS